MHIALKRIITLILFSISISCATVYVNVIKEYPPKPRNCLLDVYMIEEDIEKPYEDICILDSYTGSTAFSTKTFEQAIELSKPKACRCGADAIVVTFVDRQKTTFFTYGNGNAVVKGIRYK